MAKKKKTQSSYAKVLRSIVRKQEQSKSFKQTTQRLKKTTNEIAAADRRLKRAREIVKESRERTKAQQREVKLARAAKTKAKEKAKAVSREIREQKKTFTKNARSVYKLLGKRPTGKDIQKGLRDLKKARKGIEPTRFNVDHLVTLKFKTREKKKKGARERTYTRDLIIPAPQGSSLEDLRKIAERKLDEDAHPLLKHLRDGEATIAVGPRSTSGDVEIR